MRWWSGHRPGELTTLPKTPSWMSGFVPGRGRWGIKDRMGKYEMERGRRGKRANGKGPASQGRDRRRSK